MTDDQFIADYHRLNDDSKAFMRHIMARVAGIGVKTYGPWRATADRRNLPREISEEIFDAVVYSGMLAVKQERDDTPTLDRTPTIRISAEDLPVSGAKSIADFDVGCIDEEGMP